VSHFSSPANHVRYRPENPLGNQANFDSVTRLEAEQSTGQLDEGDIGVFQVLPAH